MKSSDTIASHRIFTGRNVKMDVDQVRFPDGSTGELEIVRHPGAAAVVPFLDDPTDPDPELLLIRQYRYAAGGYLYEIPAGKLDGGAEDPKVCAHRELKEETGYTAEHMEHMFSTLTTPGFSNEMIHIFMAYGLKEGEAATEAHEFLEPHRFRLSRVLQMIQQGDIQDAKTTIGILFAAGFRAGQ